MADRITVVPIPAFLDNYIWLLINETKRSAICVDPGEGTPVINYLQQHNLSLDAVFLTHHHFDHIGGVPDLLRFKPEVPIYGPADSRIIYVTHQVNDGERIDRLSWHFDILSIPGHTSSHISYYEPEMGWLFCGDTLFSGGCGRVFDGSLESLYASLQILKNLPDATKVYCAHEYTRQNLRFASLVEPDNLAVKRLLETLERKLRICSLPSDIAQEKMINPFFRTDQPAVKLYASSVEPFEVFKQLRADKDNFS